MKSPCEHCPFRKDVKPFLTPDRGSELAYHAQNPYNTFPCHKTTVPDESDEFESRMIETERSKECAGFVTLQIQEGMNCPHGFTPAYDLVYECSFDMLMAYEDE